LSLSGRLDAKTLGETGAAQVERLLEHFTPADLKELGKFLLDNKLPINDAAVKELIKRIGPGDMGAVIRRGQLKEVYGEVTTSPGWAGEGTTLAESTTEQAGKIPLSEFRETPGSEVLGADMT